MMTIDLFVFLTSFRVSVPQGIIMATRLLQRADKEAPDAVRGAQENLRRVCAKIDGEYTARGTRRKRDVRVTGRGVRRSRAVLARTFD